MKQFSPLHQNFRLLHSIFPFSFTFRVKLLLIEHWVSSDRPWKSSSAHNLISIIWSEASSYHLMAQLIIFYAFNWQIQSCCLSCFGKHTLSASSANRFHNQAPPFLRLVWLYQAFPSRHMEGQGGGLSQTVAFHTSGTYTCKEKRSAYVR